MAKQTFGQLSEFDPEAEISAYIERAELFFEGTGSRRPSKWLSAIGRKTSALLRNLLAPALPKQKTLKEIETVLKGHFEPAPLVIAEWFQFHH